MIRINIIHTRKISGCHIILSMYFIFFPQYWVYSIIFSSALCMCVLFPFILPEVVDIIIPFAQLYRVFLLNSKFYEENIKLQCRCNKNIRHINKSVRIY